MGKIARKDRNALCVVCELQTSYRFRPYLRNPLQYQLLKMAVGRLWVLMTMVLIAQHFLRSIVLSFDSEAVWEPRQVWSSKQFQLSKSCKKVHLPLFLLSYQRFWLGGLTSTLLQSCLCINDYCSEREVKQEKMIALVQLLYMPPVS